MFTTLLGFCLLAVIANASNDEVFNEGNSESYPTEERYENGRHILTVYFMESERCVSRVSASLSNDADVEVQVAAIKASPQRGFVTVGSSSSSGNDASVSLDKTHCVWLLEVSSTADIISLSVDSLSAKEYYAERRAKRAIAQSSTSCTLNGEDNTFAAECSQSPDRLCTPQPTGDGTTTTEIGFCSCTEDGECWDNNSPFCDVQKSEVYDFDENTPSFTDTSQNAGNCGGCNVQNDWVIEPKTEDDAADRKVIRDSMFCRTRFPSIMSYRGSIEPDFATGDFQNLGGVPMPLPDTQKISALTFKELCGVNNGECQKCSEARNDVRLGEYLSDLNTWPRPSNYPLASRRQPGNFAIQAFGAHSGTHFCFNLYPRAITGPFARSDGVWDGVATERKEIEARPICSDVWSFATAGLCPTNEELGMTIFTIANCSTPSTLSRNIWLNGRVSININIGDNDIDSRATFGDGFSNRYIERAPSTFDGACLPCAIRDVTGSENRYHSLCSQPLPFAPICQGPGCGACRTNQECLAKSDNEIDPNNLGDQSGCIGRGQCTGGTNCQFDGSCIFCRADSDCATDANTILDGGLSRTTTCNTTTGRCVAAFDCRLANDNQGSNDACFARDATTPNCNADGTCGRCTTNAQCGNVDYLGQTQCGSDANAAGVCVAGCNVGTNDNTVANNVCRSRNTNTPNCMESGNCISCTNDNDCITDFLNQPQCDTNTGVCVVAFDCRTANNNQASNDLCFARDNSLPNCNADGNCGRCLSNDLCGTVDFLGQTQCGSDANAAGVCVAGCNVGTNDNTVANNVCRTRDAQSPNCMAAGNCISCSTDAQCVGDFLDQPRCDRNTGVCVPPFDCRVANNNQGSNDGCFARDANLPNCNADGNCGRCTTNAQCGTIDFLGQTQCGSDANSFGVCIAGCNAGTTDNTVANNVCRSRDTNTPNCMAAGNCISCTSNNDCVGDFLNQPQCDTTTGVCIPAFNCRAGNPTDAVANQNCINRNANLPNCMQSGDCISCTTSASCTNDYNNNPVCGGSGICIASCRAGNPTNAVANSVCSTRSNNLPNCMTAGQCIRCVNDNSCVGDYTNQPQCDTTTGVCIPAFNCRSGDPTNAIANAACSARNGNLPNCLNSGSCNFCNNDNDCANDYENQPRCGPNGICIPAFNCRIGNPTNAIANANCVADNANLPNCMADGGCIRCTSSSQCGSADYDNNQVCNSNGVCVDCSLNRDCVGTSGANCYFDGKCRNCGTNGIGCATSGANRDGGNGVGLLDANDQTICYPNNICYANCNDFVNSNNGANLYCSNSINPITSLPSSRLNCYADGTCRSCTGTTCTADGGDIAQQPACEVGVCVTPFQCNANVNGGGASACGQAGINGAIGDNCQSDGNCVDCSVTPNTASGTVTSTCSGNPTVNDGAPGNGANQPNCRSTANNRICVAACSNNGDCANTQGANCMGGTGAIFNGLCVSCTSDDDCANRAGNAWSGDIDGNQPLCNVATGICFSACTGQGNAGGVFSCDNPIANADSNGPNCMSDGRCRNCNQFPCPTNDGPPNQVASDINTECDVNTGICGDPFCYHNSQCPATRANCGKVGNCYDCRVANAGTSSRGADQLCGTGNGAGHLGDGPAVFTDGNTYGIRDQPNCDQQTGVCVNYCTKDEHCTDSCEPHCQLDRGCCVECTADSQCPFTGTIEGTEPSTVNVRWPGTSNFPDGRTLAWRNLQATFTSCNTHTHLCSKASECMFDSDCQSQTGMPACDVGSRKCVGCTRDSHCQSGRCNSGTNTCMNLQCIPGSCANGGHCLGGNCYDCLIDAHCVGGGECEDFSCSTSSSSVLTISFALVLAVVAIFF